MIGSRVGIKEENISHTNIQDIGTTSHPDIDSKIVEVDAHIDDESLHYAVTRTANQVGHPFSVGDPVYHDGTIWQAADALTITTLGTGVVSAVSDVDNFTITVMGYVSGLSGLTTGDWYYVNDAGALDDAPGAIYTNPLMQALSATEALVLPLRADETVGLEGQTSRVFYDASSYMYVCRAARGSDTSAPVWRISRFDDTDGTILYADGDQLYNNICDNRESLSYS